FRPRGRAARAFLLGRRQVGEIADRIGELAVLAAKQVARIARGELELDLGAVAQDRGAVGENRQRDAEIESGKQREGDADQDRSPHQEPPPPAGTVGRAARKRVSRMAPPSSTLPPSSTKASDTRSLVSQTSKITIRITAAMANVNVLRRAESLAPIPVRPGGRPHTAQ